MKPLDAVKVLKKENVNEWINIDYGNKKYHARYFQNRKGEVFHEKNGQTSRIEWFKSEKGNPVFFKPQNFKSLLKQTIKQDEMLFIPDISVPKLRKVKVEKDYTNHLILTVLGILFIIAMWNGWLSGEQFIN